MKLNNLLDTFKSNSNSLNKNIVIPEQDSRIIDAKNILKKFDVNIIETSHFTCNKEKYFDYLSSLKFTDNWNKNNINQLLLDPVYFAMSMVACGDADCMVSGATLSSSEVIRNSIRIIGMKADAECVSSMFFMVNLEKNIYYSISDCAVIPEPNAKQLAAIAFETSNVHKLITNEEPRIAFLSFSTYGSASHYRVKIVQDAVKKFGLKYPNIIHEGEIQLDAAIVPDIAKYKNKKTILKGNANVLIFPNLDAGNIGYKLMQRFGDFMACGPILLGLNKPSYDLSRGCTVEDIVNTSLIALLNAKSS